LTTSESMIADKPQEAGAGAPPMGGMGGMPGMMESCLDSKTMTESCLILSQVRRGFLAQLFRFQ